MSETSRLEVRSLWAEANFLQRSALTSCFELGSRSVCAAQLQFKAQEQESRSVMPFCSTAPLQTTSALGPAGHKVASAECPEASVQEERGVFPHAPLRQVKVWSALFAQTKPRTFLKVPSPWSRLLKEKIRLFTFSLPFHSDPQLRDVLLCFLLKTSTRKSDFELSRRSSSKPEPPRWFSSHRHNAENVPGYHGV
ncbi:Uncharacterized protein DAT39_020823 [Clarias magur]|uniref:Uncharacterized protein n=1 Tax=Clarias magur TaxID=1594786 RepID=A0A8J4X0T3_CLAMG|nr:Uncharacterized protein DAT39_020823 [Clarias magur]